MHNHKELAIHVMVTDSNGRKFDNFSSLAIDWELSDHSIAELGNSGQVSSKLTTTDLGTKKETSKNLLYSYHYL